MIKMLSKSTVETKQIYRHSSSIVDRDGVKFWGFVLNDETSRSNFYFTVPLEMYLNFAKIYHDEILIDKAIIKEALKLRKYNPDNFVIIGIN